jgi:hypothetical protein
MPDVILGWQSSSSETKKKERGRKGGKEGRMKKKGRKEEKVSINLKNVCTFPINAMAFALPAFAAFKK